jgi:glycosyltransferase involved in cell wall biosynthesis
MTGTSTRSPRVSFVMATHAFDDQVVEAIRSCLAQNYDDFEVVIVANGMDDISFGRLETFCRIDERVRLERTSVRRLTFSLNLGIHRARGELLARMDSDDVSYPHRLATQVQYMDEHPDIGLCGTWCDLIDDEGQTVGEWRLPTLHQEIVRRLQHPFGNSAAFCHPTVMCRRSVMLELGGYTGFYAEDFATWALLTAMPGVRFANLPQRLLAYRADHSGHRRNLTWRAGKALCAGTQLQMFCTTRNPRWLVGMALNVAKTFLRRR